MKVYILHSHVRGHREAGHRIAHMQLLEHRRCEQQLSKTCGILSPPEKTASGGRRFCPRMAEFELKPDAGRPPTDLWKRFRSAVKGTLRPIQAIPSRLFRSAAQWT